MMAVFRIENILLLSSTSVHLSMEKCVFIRNLIRRRWKENENLTIFSVNVTRRIVIGFYKQDRCELKLWMPESFSSASAEARQRFSW